MADRQVTDIGFCWSSEDFGPLSPSWFADVFGEGGTGYDAENDCKKLAI